MVLKSRMGHRVIFLLVGVLIGAAGTAVGLRWYENRELPTARATLYVAPTPSDLLEPVGYNREEFIHFRDTQIAVVTSRRTLEDVAEKMQEYSLLSEQEDPVAYLKSKLSVTAVGDSSFVEIRFTDETKDEAQLRGIVDEVADCYLARRTDEELRLRHRQIEALQGQALESIMDLDRLRHALSSLLGDKVRDSQSVANGADQELLQLRHQIDLHQRFSDAVDRRLQSLKLSEAAPPRVWLYSEAETLVVSQGNRWSGLF